MKRWSDPIASDITKVQAREDRSAPARLPSADLSAGLDHDRVRSAAARMDGRRRKADETMSEWQCARFVDHDGRSFFDTVDPNRHVWLRREYEDIDMASRSDFATASLRVRELVYERELWYVPIGPLACPLVTSDPMPGDERIDVIYRERPR